MGPPRRWGRPARPALGAPQPCATSRPSFSTPTWSANVSSSCTWCVEAITVVGVSARCSASRVSVRRRTTGSSPSVGSLKKVLDGIPMSLADFFSMEQAPAPRTLTIQPGEIKTPANPQQAETHVDAGAATGTQSSGLDTAPEAPKPFRVKRKDAVFPQKPAAPTESNANTAPDQAVAPGLAAVLRLRGEHGHLRRLDAVERLERLADRGVRVFTVGLGNAQGGMASFEGWSIYMRFDEETLKAIADVTRGEYFAASSATELNKVYENLNAKFKLEKKETEITAIVTAAAALLALIAGGHSLVWFNRLV